MVAISQSHPTWVCGLKHTHGRFLSTLIKSHPTWVCGLKHITKKTTIFFLVTPYVGVWIETLVLLLVVSSVHVTPYVGVWIET